MGTVRWFGLVTFIHQTILEKEMTQFEHTLVATVLVAFIFNVWIKRYFISGKEWYEWKEFLGW